jgi:hypothetical protein
MYTAMAHNTNAVQEKGVKILAGKSPSLTTQPLKMKMSRSVKNLPFVRTPATLHKIPEDKNHHHQWCGNVKSRDVQ